VVVGGVGEAGRRVGAGEGGRGEGGAVGREGGKEAEMNEPPEKKVKKVKS